MFFYDPTYIILIPAILFALYAQNRVNSQFNRYSNVSGGRGITGAEAARRVLDKHGLYNVAVIQTRGSLTDHYNPSERTVNLSETVYGSTSVAAISVACHECGHAVQHQEDYAPLRIRDSILPLVNISSSLSWILIMVGIGLLAASSSQSGSQLGQLIFNIGVMAFIIITLFHLITLPLEFNASSRGLKEMEELELVLPQNMPGAKKVLKAAAMTYVAALATSVANLLRILLIARGNRRNG